MNGYALMAWCDDLGHVWRWRADPISYYYEGWFACIHCWRFVQVVPRHD